MQTIAHELHGHFTSAHTWQEQQTETQLWVKQNKRSKVEYFLIPWELWCNSDSVALQLLSPFPQNEFFFFSWFQRVSRKFVVFPQTF